MNTTKRQSYVFFFLFLVLMGWLRLGPPFLAILFSYFALEKLNFARNKWLTVVLFLTLVAAVFYGFAFFLKQAFVALPHVISTSIPSMLEFARRHKIELPFDDMDSLKALTLDTVKSQMHGLGQFARVATKEFMFMVLGVAVAVTMFMNPKLDLERETHRLSRNLYSAWCEALAERFRTFYESFAVVMGAQLTISAINTVLTAGFVFPIGLPYPLVIVGVSFLCGMLPIVGNLLSNAVIVAIAFTVSPQMAFSALVFLVLLHKLEYFLNSKIVGDRIKNPIWLTLVGLILGERLMGIPGMILAPVVLFFARLEMGRLPAEES